MFYEMRTKEKTVSAPEYQQSETEKDTGGKD